MQFKKVLLAFTLLVSSFSMMAYEFTINGSINFPNNFPFFETEVYITSSNGTVDFILTDVDGNFTATYEVAAGTIEAFNVETFDWCTGEVLVETLDSEEGTVEVSFDLCGILLEDCQAYFSYESDYFTNEVAFTNTSFTTGINSYTWDFGDGNTSTDENPVHIYADEGYYDVSLTIATDSCASTSINSIYAGNPFGTDCITSFYYSANDLNNPLVIDFTDESIAADAITAWAWDLGDGNVSTDQNPTHTYAEDGIYFITLTITTESGCTSTSAYEIYLGDIIWGGDCASHFSYEVDPDDDLTFTFTDESAGDVTSWLWDFGDGNMSTEQNPTHTYANAGTYIAALTITTADGCTNYYCIFLFPGDGGTGNGGCDVWFFAENTGGYNYQFYSGDIFGLPFESVSWDFGDGNTSTEFNPSHEYAADGLYDVVLTAVSNGDTCDVTLPIDVYYNEVPECEAIFSYYAEDWQNPNVVTFYDYSIALSPIVAWEWDFGTGDTSTEQFPIYTYAEEGVYIVTLTITTESGCTSTYESSVYVENTGCGCGFEFDPVCVDLGNGFIIEYLNPCLAECDGFTDFVDCNIDPPAACDASFFWSIDANNLTVDFLDFSYATGTILEWNWDLGDGTTSNEQNPTHTYATNNEYIVTLTITTDDGCTSAFTASFNFNGGSVGGDQTTAYFWLEQNQDNLMEFTFIDQSMGDVDTWAWDFGDGNSSTAQNPTHTYAEAGIYLVTLYVSNSVDGSSSIYTNLISTDTDIWYNNECQSLFIPFIQDDFNVGFMDLSWGAAVDYTWDFGDGTTSSEPFFVEHTYPGAGIYEATLMTTTADGCASEFSITINLIDFGFTGNGTAAAITISSNEELATFDSFKVGPNPVQDELNISIDHTSNADAVITMTNQLGQNVVLQKATLLAGTNQLTLNTANLATGVYYLNIQTTTNKETTMIVKY